MEQLRSEHVQELYELTETNRDYLREWLPWLDQIKSVADTAAFVESTIKESASEGAPNFALLNRNRIIGVAGFHKIDKLHHIGSIGWRKI